MDVRQRILQAAAQVYSETGFRGATTRRIAQLAGVNEITLFRHFGSKTRLLHEAIHCAGDVNLCHLPDRPKDVRQELRDWAQATYEEMWSKRSLIRTSMGEIEEHPDLMPRDKGGISAIQDLERYLHGLKGAGLAHASFDAAVASAMLMGALFSDTITRDILPQLYRADRARTIEQYVDLFLRSIGVEVP